MNVYLSVCSRSDKTPISLDRLRDWAYPDDMMVAYDASSVYQGHQSNINHWNSGWNIYGKEETLKDDDVICLVHDDVEILSDKSEFLYYLELCNKPRTGFVGVAGGTIYDNNAIKGAWWNARAVGASRGFVFQGVEKETMVPNYFGPHGQCVVLDGLFLACSYKTLKLVGLDQPQYLSSGWDFYDIHLTLKAHLMGLNNYTVPIICKHESAGNMRQDWYTARDQFLRHHYNNLPVRLNYDKTNGYPCKI